MKRLNDDDSGMKAVSASAGMFNASGMSHSTVKCGVVLCCAVLCLCVFVFFSFLFLFRPGDGWNGTCSCATSSQQCELLTLGRFEVILLLE